MPVGRKRNAPKAHVEACFEKFKNSPELQLTQTKIVAEEFGVSAATVSRFRKSLGLPPWRPTLTVDPTPILQDKDFGLISGKATASLDELGKRHGVSPWFVRKLMIEHGVAPSFRPQGGRKVKVKRSLIYKWKRNPQLNDIPRTRLRARW